MQDSPNIPSSPLVNRYAQAVFSLAMEQGLQGQVVDELNAFERLLQDNRGLRECLLNPFIPGERKQAVVAELFDAVFLPLTRNFLRLLITKRREPIMAGITRRVNDLLRQSRGILAVRLASAQKLTAEQAATIRDRLSLIFKRQVELETAQDAELLGGIVIQAGYRLIDGSIRGQLDNIQYELSRN